VLSPLYLFITVKTGFPRFEVKGAAITTVISQVVAFLIAITACVKRSMYEQLIVRLGLSFYTMLVSTLGCRYRAKRVMRPVVMG
jgi:Na+-driven multidrug efflux pump